MPGMQHTVRGRLLLGALCLLVACSGDDGTGDNDQSLGGSSADSGRGGSSSAGSSAMDSGAGGSGEAGSTAAGKGGSTAAGAGGSNTAGADAGNSDAGMAGDGGSGDPNCEQCIDQATSWGPNGGLVAYNEGSSLESCGNYMHERVPFGDGVQVRCMREIPCSGGLIGTTEVEQAFADPDVQAALAMKNVLYGRDSRPVDGQVFRIERGGNVIEVGGACMGGQGCVEIPEGVAALVALLRELDEQQLMLDPCAGLFD